MSSYLYSIFSTLSPSVAPSAAPPATETPPPPPLDIASPSALQLVTRTMLKLEKEHRRLQTLLHGDGSDFSFTSPCPSPSSLKSANEVGRVGKKAPSIGSPSPTEDEKERIAAGKQHQPASFIGIADATNSPASPTNNHKQSKGGMARLLPPSIANTTTTTTDPSSLFASSGVLLPSQRAAHISPKEWASHSKFLLTAVEGDDDALFEVLGRIALFCQAREGGADFGRDYNAIGRSHNAEGEEEGGSSEGRDVMGALEEVRKSLDDRCQLLRALMDVCDANVKKGLADLKVITSDAPSPSSSARDGRGRPRSHHHRHHPSAVDAEDDAVIANLLTLLTEITTMTPPNTSGSTNNSGVTAAKTTAPPSGDKAPQQPTQRQSQQRTRQLVPRGGKNSLTAALALRSSAAGGGDDTTKCTNGCGEGCGFSNNDSSFGSKSSSNASFVSSSSLNGAEGVEGSGRKMVGGMYDRSSFSIRDDEDALFLKAERYQFQSILQQYKQIKAKCLALLHEGRHTSRLFAVLDDVAAFCVAYGHPTDELVMVIQPKSVVDAGTAALADGLLAGKKEPQHSSSLDNRDTKDGGMRMKDDGDEDGSDQAGPEVAEATTTRQRRNKMSQRVAAHKYRQRRKGEAKNDASNNTETTTNASASTPTRQEAQVVRLGNGMLATVMLEVPLDELDIEAEARRVQEVQEIVRNLQEIRELEAMIAAETQRQGVELEHSEAVTATTYDRAVRGRQQLVKASKHRIVFVTLAGGLLGAAIGGPVGLAIGAKTAATILSASAVGSLSTAVAANVAAKLNAVEVDAEYEEARLLSRERS